MDLPEEAYEEELIDAFDAPEPDAAAPSERFSASQLYRHSDVGPPARPGVQEAHATLYPTFDAAPAAPEAPVAAAMAPLKLPEPPTSQVYRQDALMSGQELQRRRQQIEREMCVYQERFEHVAQALAGETPHQIEEREKREQERLQRQEKRHEATATRLEHQLERLEEREERRARIRARHHRASRSPSPSCGREGPDEDVGLDKQGHE